ncbi:hypothetical protein CEUSTIGMA_g1445.t1 [Chlamydomonas eustigma]|uniref:Calcium-dependent protein kinase n=1 Tax=Chlamydomonas eustigma TaxID=1157962 RepID=A0A250WT54_9CHLO|nr:hypothetical protein CEUSTIGMA_g1445.t1 [Chlamydomonas eustigma]|eukprot:GAX73995.1 hypothetical protein CEUSTIGMA_g1445.t1 [Chlamydomonas eustigma]
MSVLFREKMRVYRECNAIKSCRSPLILSKSWRMHHQDSRRERVAENSWICFSTDYVATASDDGVLKLNPRTDLSADEITHVFGYARDLKAKYTLGKVIGAGSFGIVRECNELSSGRRYAVKTISKAPKRGLATPRYLLKLRTEVEIMQQLGYSLDAVNLKDVFEDDENVHLVMEVCDGGVLLERIEKEKYSEKFIIPIVRSILRFISQCHTKGFIYRDVKPDNFLFQTKDADSHLKATDFGLSIKHWPHERKLTSRSGTPAYMAPELVMQSYDEKCDVWSVGMLTYQMLTGRFPYWEDVRRVSLTDVWRAILTDDLKWDAPELKQLSRPAVDFLQSLLQRDPANRPSAQDCLQHPWVVDDTNAADLPLEGSVVQRLQRFSTYGLLKQMVLKMIVDDMAAGGDAAAALKSQPSVGVPADVVEGLQSLFNELDVDRSGSITMSELSQGLRKQGYSLTDNEIEQLMRKVDANHDGDVSINEFMTTLLDWNLIQESQGWKSFVDRAFDNLDKDGNGFINLEELVQLLPTVMTDTGRPVSAEERLATAKQMLREADTNGDGKISRDEFLELLKEHQTPDSLSFYDDRVTRSA